jgi:hypothetical protein
VSSRVHRAPVSRNDGKPATSSSLAWQHGRAHREADEPGRRLSLDPPGLIEGRTGATLMAKWQDVRKVATIAPDYAYGRDAVGAFIEYIKKFPDIEIVDQQWPKLGEPAVGPTPASAALRSH